MASRGFIQTIVILFLVLVILSLLGINLSQLTENQALRENFSLVWDGIKFLWERYLLHPTEVVWNLFLKLMWQPILEMLGNLASKLESIKP